ncbi:uncharacterized protein [Panulirus ornatus]|uniref:uncharacterized protein n=1 Tax=Panulirus ornatus TaxID=150431 RepID=UPI003A845878
MSVNKTGEGVEHPQLIKFAIFHCCTVFVVGAIGNGVTLWCIATCTRLQRAVKVLLASVFLPLLLICLVSGPITSQVLTAVLANDPYRFSRTFEIVHSLFYSALAQMVHVYIAAVSLFRAVAVWSPHRQAVKLRVAVAVVTCIFIYSVLVTVGMLGSMYLGYVQERSLKRTVTVLYFFLNTMMPILVTITCYGTMMFVVRRNKRRLANSQHSVKAHSACDEATRAMLAVFLSTLILGFPHSVYHMIEDPPMIYDIIFHILFSTHFALDPLVFVWFNRNYRKRTVEKMRLGLAWITRCSSSSPTPKTNSSALHNYTSTSVSPDHTTSSKKQTDSAMTHGTDSGE